jgi:hypothetical protein
VLRHRAGGGDRSAVAAAAAALVCLLLAPAAARAAWEPARPADNSGAQSGATFPRTALAVGGNGLATALFFQAGQGTPAGQPGTPFAIRRPRDAALWSAPAPISAPAGHAAGGPFPALAAEPGGSALAAFVFEADDGKKALASRWPAAGASPGQAVPLLCTASKCAGAGLEVAVDGTGNGHAVASIDDGANNDVLYARTDSSGAWQPAEVLGQGYFPHLAVDGAGDVLVTYQRSETSPLGQTFHLFAKRRLADDPGFGPERQLSGENNTNPDATAADAVIDAGGDAAVVFVEDTLPPVAGYNAGVVQAVRWPRASATPSGQQQISRSPQDDGSAQRVTLAVDPQGRLTAGWDASTGTSFAVFSADGNGTEWRAPERRSPANTPDSYSVPDLAVDAEGTATLVYLKAPPPGSTNDIVVQRRPAGGPWTSLQSLRSKDPNAGAVSTALRSYDVAAARPGQADVVFVEQLGGTNRLFATRFEEPPPTVTAGGRQLTLTISPSGSSAGSGGGAGGCLPPGTVRLAVQTRTIRSFKTRHRGARLARVDFYIDGTHKGRRKRRPFALRVSIAGLAAGPHRVTARIVLVSRRRSGGRTKTRKLVRRVSRRFTICSSQ